MSSTTTLYVLTISYREEFTINGAIGYSVNPHDITLERYFPYKPTLSDIKEAIPDRKGDRNWIALDEREVEIKKTTLLGITNEVEKSVM